MQSVLFQTNTMVTFNFYNKVIQVALEYRVYFNIWQDELKKVYVI